MRKLKMSEFAKWLGYDEQTIQSAIEIVGISDSDGAYTHAEDMGEFEIAEIIDAIYFEHGSLEDAINACKKDLGIINEGIKKLNLNEFKILIKKIIKEETENPCWKGYEQYGTKKKKGKVVPNCVPVNEENKMVKTNRVINDLKKIPYFKKHTHAELSHLIKKYPGKSAPQIHKSLITPKDV